MTASYNNLFMTKPTAGYRLGQMRQVWESIVNQNGASSAYGIAAAGTNQATGTVLTSVINEIDTVAASTGVLLPSSTGNRATPFQRCIIINNGANALTVYAAIPVSGTADTINGVAGATGISVPAATVATFVSAKNGAWFSDADTSGAFGALTATTFNGSTLLTGAGAIATGTTAYGSSALSLVSSTTLQQIPGLSAALVTSGTYSILAELPVTVNLAAGGVQIAAAASNSLTATSFSVTGKFLTAGGNTAAINTTTLGGSVGTATSTILAELAGTIVVNTGGTLIIQAAQQASQSSTTTINAGGFLQVTRIS